MSLKPIGERVIIRKIERKDEETTAGGIILTSKSSNTPDSGEVLAIGTSDKLHDIKLGDEIYFQNGKEIEIEFNGERYFVVNLQDIYAVKER